MGTLGWAQLGQRSGGEVAGERWVVQRAGDGELGGLVRSQCLRGERRVHSIAQQRDVASAAIYDSLLHRQITCHNAQESQHHCQLKAHHPHPSSDALRGLKLQGLQTQFTVHQLIQKQEQERSLWSDILKMQESVVVAV